MGFRCFLRNNAEVLITKRNARFASGSPLMHAHLRAPGHVDKHVHFHVKVTSVTGNPSSSGDTLAAFVCCRACV